MLEWTLDTLELVSCVYTTAKLLFRIFCKVIETLLELQSFRKKFNR